jgi:hypothetical protein
MGVGRVYHRSRLCERPREIACRPEEKESVPVESLIRESVPVAIEGDGVEVKLKEVGEMTVGFFTLPAGTDMRPLLKGLEGDLCQCPHWGYMLKGKLRMHTSDGSQDYTAGNAFYWAPGHAPEAIEDCEYVDFSPTTAFDPVVRHIQQQAEAAS